MDTLLAVGPFLLEISSNERLARWWMPLEVKTTWGFAKMRPLAHAAAGANPFIARYFQQNGALRCARWFMGTWGRVAGGVWSQMVRTCVLLPICPKPTQMPETSADDPAIVRSQIPVPFEWHQNFVRHQKMRTRMSGSFVSCALGCAREAYAGLLREGVFAQGDCRGNARIPKSNARELFGGCRAFVPLRRTRPTSFSEAGRLQTWSGCHTLHVCRYHYSEKRFSYQYLIN